MGCQVEWQLYRKCISTVVDQGEVRELLEENAERLRDAHVKANTTP